MSKLCSFSWPDVERNGHHGVEDDDVAPEAEEASVGGGVAFAVVQVPGVGSDVVVPEGVTDGQPGRHQDEQSEDLHRGSTTPSAAAAYRGRHSILFLP